MDNTALLLPPDILQRARDAGVLPAEAAEAAAGTGDGEGAIAAVDTPLLNPEGQRHVYSCLDLLKGATNQVGERVPC